MRRILAVLLAACLILACGGPGPGEVVEGFFDAVKSGDGEKAADCLSQSAIDEMSDMREFLLSDSDAVAAYAAEMGIPVERLRNSGDREFVALFLGSEGAREDMEGLDVAVGDAEVNGLSATVQVTYTQDGESRGDEILLVKEDGGWKLVVLDFR